MVEKKELENNYKWIVTKIIGDCENRMQSSLNNFNDNLKKNVELEELNPSMLDGIMVDYYGMKLH